jgi:hypothetical protein
MRAALLSLLLALPLFAEYRFEPVAPTDRSFVVLQIREAWGGCLPQNERITRNGNAFTVLYETPKNTTCPAAFFPWDEDAPLGALPAGTYTVTVQVDDFGGLRTLATIPLVVTEAAPALRYSPRIASTAGGTEITFAGVCNGTVLVDGAAVPSRVENCNLIATLPAHAPGPVNVRVGSSEIVNAVQYVDPAAAPAATLYERVLIPVLYNGPGAFGSQWETEVLLQGGSPGVLPDVSAPLRPNRSLQTLFGNRAAGLVLFLPRGQEWSFASHIRDVSRDASQWGTEIPVVREGDTRRNLVLQNVPFDPRYRLQLRIYNIDGVSTQVIVRRAITPHTVSVVGPCTAMPCNSNQPAYASVDLRRMFPDLTGTQTIDVQQVVLPPLRLWAFITVTNDETQHVTVISPQ